VLPPCIREYHSTQSKKKKAKSKKQKAKRKDKPLMNTPPNAPLSSLSSVPDTQYHMHLDLREHPIPLIQKKKIIK
jgi:hypothetical protein